MMRCALSYMSDKRCALSYMSDKRTWHCLAYYYYGTDIAGWGMVVRCCVECEASAEEEEEEMLHSATCDANRSNVHRANAGMTCARVTCMHGLGVQTSGIDSEGCGARGDRGKPCHGSVRVPVPAWRLPTELDRVSAWCMAPRHFSFALASCFFCPRRLLCLLPPLRGIT